MDDESSFRSHGPHAFANLNIPSKDLSAGEAPSRQTGVSDDVRLQLAQQQFRHRESMFGIALSAAALMYIVMVIYLFGSAFLSSGAPSTQLGILAILAAMPSSIMLGIMAFVFRREKDSSDSKPEDFSALFSLIKHIGDAIKDIVGSIRK